MAHDIQEIIKLHGSALTDEQKAAASKEFMKDAKAARNSPAKVHRTRAAASEEEALAGGEDGANGGSRVRRKPVKVVKRPAGADASQPWGATSPTRVKAASQVSDKAWHEKTTSDGSEVFLCDTTPLFCQLVMYLSSKPLCGDIV